MWHQNETKLFNKNVEVKALQEIEDEKQMEMQQVNMLHQQTNSKDGEKDDAEFINK